MTDSKSVSNLSFGPNGTFNGFKYNELPIRRIDYVFISNISKIEVEKYAVLSSSIDFKFPSDHFPVFVKFVLK